MSKKAPWYSPVFVLALPALLVLASRVPAQGARVNGGRYYPIAPLRLMDTGGELGLRYDYFSQSESFEGGDDLEIANHYFQEYVLGRTRGYIYHPRLVDFRAEGKIGLLQQIIRESGYSSSNVQDESNDGTIDGYDVYAYFLKEHPVSFSAFANRDREPLLELFTDRFMLERESRGASANWRNRYVPMNVSFTRTLSKEWGSDSHTDSKSDVLQYNARNKVANWMRTDFRYRYQEYNQQFRSDAPQSNIDRETHYRSHNADFTNSIYLSHDKRSFLSSTARYYNQRGTQDLETFDWRERLQLQHTRTFRTYYQAGYQRNNVQDGHVNSYRGEAGAEHKLYKSLQSHVDIHGRRTEFQDDLRENVVGGTGRVDYRKRTGLGYLTAGYSRTLDRFERKGGGTGIQFIINESLTLRSGVTSFLENPDVIGTSIVVTDPQNQVVYLEGFDYDVLLLGNRTGIEIHPGGNLSDGDTVFVDYQFEFDSDFHYYSDDQDFHIRHDFQKLLTGLSVYYRWHDLSAHDLPNDRDLRVLTYTDQMVGGKFRWKDLEWTEEYREYDSNVTSYRQLRSQLDGSHRLTPTLRWGWTAGIINTGYLERIPGDGKDADFYFASTRVNGSLLRNGYWSVEGRGQKETGRTERTLLGVLGKLGFKWRQVRVETGARYEHFDVFDSERDRAHVFVQIARVF